MAKGHVVMDWTDPDNGLMSPEVRHALILSGMRFDTSGRLTNMRRLTDKDGDTRIPKIFLIEVPEDCACVMVTPRGPEWITKFHGKPVDSSPRSASSKKGRKGKGPKSLGEFQDEASVRKSASQSIGSIS